jgi:hypothetical protein
MPRSRERDEAADERSTEIGALLQLDERSSVSAFCCPAARC